MGILRLLVSQGEAVYRFLAIDPSGDGSVVVSMDRDVRVKSASWRADSLNQWVPVVVDQKARPSARFTIHTSGAVHYYHQGNRARTIYIPPLYDLCEVHDVAFLSIPKIGSLDRAEGKLGKSDLVFALHFEEAFEDRISFGLAVGPLDKKRHEVGVSVTFELYALHIFPVANQVVPPTPAADHFIYGLSHGVLPERRIGKEWAEINYFSAVHGPGLKLFQNSDGSYVLLTAVPMRITPKLSITFDRSDLTAELKVGECSAHKLRFWIRDRGGRNTREDLRCHIIGLALDSEL